MLGWPVRLGRGWRQERVSKIHPMKIELRLHGNFRKYIGGSHDTLDLEIPDGATINDVLEQLGVEDRDFWMSAVNREVAERTAVLHDGDRVEFFGPVAGGNTCLGQT